MSASGEASLRQAAQLLADGRLADAAEACEALIRFETGQPSLLARAFRMLGEIRSRQGAPSDAIDAYLEAVGHDPADAESYFHLGVLMFRGGIAAAAAETLTEAARLAPDNGTVWHNLGLALKAIGQIEMAEQSFRQAISLDQGDIRSLKALAFLLRATGRSEEAARLFRAVIALEPGDSEVLLVLADLTADPADHSVIDAMEHLLTRQDIGDQDRVQLGFGLFKAHDRVGNHTLAFAHLKVANDLQRRRLPYDLAAEKVVFADLKRFFRRDFLAGIEGHGDEGAAPIFIVGMPRSGTTLVEQIVSAHSTVAAGGESPAMTNLVRDHLVKPGVPGLALEADLFSAVGAAQLRRDYLARIGDVVRANLLFTDKMPLNFRFIGIIAAILPRARFIHCRRDPVETCFSVYSSYFPTGGNRYSYDLDELADYYCEYRALMAHWQSLLPSRIIEQPLQAMIADQEGETRKLLDFLGLDFEPACLDFQNNRNPVTTLSAGQVRKPVYGGHQDRIRPYRPFLAPLIARLTAMAGD